MNAETILKVIMPYCAVIALAALVATGKISPELATVLAAALAMPSPLEHMLRALRGGSDASPQPPPDAPSP